MKWSLLSVQILTFKAIICGVPLKLGQPTSSLILPALFPSASILRAAESREYVLNNENITRAEQSRLLLLLKAHCCSCSCSFQKAKLQMHHL